MRKNRAVVAIPKSHAEAEAAAFGVAFAFPHPPGGVPGGSLVWVQNENGDVTLNTVEKQHYEK